MVSTVRLSCIGQGESISEWLPLLPDLRGPLTGRQHSANLAIGLMTCDMNSGLAKMYPQTIVIPSTHDHPRSHLIERD